MTDWPTYPRAATPTTVNELPYEPKSKPITHPLQVKGVMIKHYRGIYLINLNKITRLVKIKYI